MTDGLNLTGFNDTKPVGASPWPTESYTEAPAAAVPAKDMSSQGAAGTTNKMVHTAAETSAFGTGN
jgi:hypothetical protein